MYETHIWLRIMDLNHDLLSQSQACYHYTNPEYMVIPAGFEPSITALKERRPSQLVEGTTPARPFGLIFIYAEIRIVPSS